MICGVDQDEFERVDLGRRCPWKRDVLCRVSCSEYFWTGTIGDWVNWGLGQLGTGTIGDWG
jgi:hypothetical protein